MTLARYYSDYGYYGTRSTSDHIGIYIVLYLAVIIIPLIAQINVSSTFKKYSKIGNSRGLTADQVARQILDSNGLHYVEIEHIKGNLSDHFDPRTNVVRLSDSVYGQTSVAAIGVAAHECGHACQHAESYGPILLRSKLVPVTNICSHLWYIVLIIGCVLSAFTIGTALIYVSIAMFAAVVIFQTVTLPVEFDASNRALKTLANDGILEPSEVPHAGKVLKAAALTYVASLLASVLQLFRLLLSTRRR
ncbi:MAG: zinc metallopeptidase [Ruminococcus sp.]|nr:zinc metallopeptidase [Ruminococcus sp.]